MSAVRRGAVGSVLALVLLAVGLPAASADHLQARDISTACPADQVGSRSEGYSDTDGSVFAREIACLADYRITLGTGDGRYAPEGTVSRAQMARFLARLAQISRLPLRTDYADDFTDTAHLDAATRDAISAVRALGITYGVTPDRFAPGAPVTRAQMAGFLARLLQRLQVPVTEAAYGAFDDDDGSVLEYEIASVAGLGIATGLGGEQHRLFAPGRTVTRGQMAGFLARTLDASVDHGPAGSPYVARESLEAPVRTFSTDASLIVLDDPAMEAPDESDRYLYVDPNDEVRFGDRAARPEELLASLTMGDRLRVEYAPNYHESSTWTVLDDLVEPPTAVLATVLVGDDGVQDDVRVVWTAPDSRDGVVERRRSTPGSDGRCGTGDDPAYVADGTVEGERGVLALPFPDDPDPANPFVVDADRADGSCYRYAVRSVSDRLPGSTPSAFGSPSNAVRVGGVRDTTAPTLSGAERAPEAEDDDHPRVVRYSFANEAFVLPALQRPDFPNYDALALQCAFDNSPSYEQALVLFRAESSTLLGTQAFGEHVPTCDEALVQPVAVVDERGNANLEQMRVPFAATF